MPQFVEAARHAIERRAKRFGLGVAIDAAAIVCVAVALCFFTFAAFVYAQGEWGTLTASLALGGVYLTFAAALYLWSRRLAHRAVAPRGDDAGRYLLSAAATADKRQEWLVAPVFIAAGIEALRRIGAQRLIPAFALSAVAVAAARATMRPNGGAKKDDQKSA
ncbi:MULTISPECIES: phage holin family protein [Methylosinus]|uniref:Uncharacterized protein n=1 Tax=Methylosinus trichosporium (strain ATCC 35070 / NCIMB 11131 / UNIQEM 75 / OB3b) TaxID=595536 RepID=A0A2D2CWL0_METT3|nr:MULTISPECIES: phage holin family protein [Methylosinus]ATQ67049.1 hypothetical protein CQW49_03475 [Methylosinus trichosporium OB3b]OBS50849.1 hypothetical protein A8B73_19410 [Methylosinus sp. 3S-1]